jgi:sulfur-oxidizing protein SoxY
MVHYRIRTTCLSGLIAASAVLGAITAVSAQVPTDPWPDLVRAVFGDRRLDDGSGFIVLDMPGRAEDAAVVPVTVRMTLPPNDARRVKTVTLVIDQNPAPVAATFQIGPNAGVSSISTRVRVDSYTNVHAVAELTDGRLYEVMTYVKASGGCSAPALKNVDEARAEIGQMKFRQLPSAASVGALPEAQLMVRHPNNSGLQMDQVTRLYTPVFFVRELRIWQGEELVLSVDGGISISENPNIRFDYVPNGARTFRAEAIDTENHVFKAEWPIESPRM